MTQSVDVLAAQVREALDWGYNIGECAEHPDHLMRAERAARKALPAFFVLVGYAKRAEEAEARTLDPKPPTDKDMFSGFF